MRLDILVNYFLPPQLKNNPLQEGYEERYSIITGALIMGSLMAFLALLLNICQFSIPTLTKALLYNGLSILAVLPFFRWNLQKQAFFVNSIVLYWIYFPVFMHTGGIYSVYIAFLYIYLLGAFYGQPTFGIVYTVSNIAMLWFVYRYTYPLATLGSTFHAFGVHSIITLSFGLTFWQFHKRKDQLIAENKRLLNDMVDQLNEEVTRRTQEINTMRKSLASDFHDETGNLLSAITRQATMLKLSLKTNQEIGLIVDQIITNSNQLYASSRHFMWHLQHNSDDPLVVFEYLISFGQSFYNQFNISFSAQNQLLRDLFKGRMEPFAGINLIFIVKEVMTNVIKHAQASEVTFIISYNTSEQRITLRLIDDGQWKQPDLGTSHYGLSNIERRCLKQNFKFTIYHTDSTIVEINVPIIPDLITKNLSS